MTTLADFKTKAALVLNVKYGTWNKTTAEFDPLTITVKFTQNEDGLFVTLCDDYSSNLANYYGQNEEFGDGIPWICEELQQWAKDNYGKDAFWDWENPEMISLSL